MKGGTIGVLGWALNLRTGKALGALTLYGDQPHDRIATNKARKLITITGDTMPELLRNVAAIMEQEGFSSLDELAAHAVEQRRATL